MLHEVLMYLVKTYKLLVFKRIFTLALSTKFITKLLYYQMFLLLRAFTHDKLSLATRKTLMDALKGLCVWSANRLFSKSPEFAANFWKEI